MAITVRPASDVRQRQGPSARTARPNRARQIATILARNGFGFMIGRVSRDVRVSLAQSHWWRRAKAREGSERS